MFASVVFEFECVCVFFFPLLKVTLRGASIFFCGSWMDGFFISRLLYWLALPSRTSHYFEGIVPIFFSEETSKTHRLVWLSAKGKVRKLWVVAPQFFLYSHFFLQKKKKEEQVVCCATGWNVELFLNQFNIWLNMFGPSRGLSNKLIASINFVHQLHLSRKSWLISHCVFNIV